MMKKALKILAFAFLLISTLELISPPPIYSQITIPDETAWTDHGLVIDSSEFGTAWDGFFEGTTPCSLIKHNGVYYQYYIGADDYIDQLNNIGPSNRAIGVATSTDGVRWQKYAGNPIVTFTSSGNPEEGAVSCGVYVDTGGNFTMYYGANIASTPTTAQVNANIMLATSTNGKDFSSGTIVGRYNNSWIWGYGDELHAVGSLFANNAWYAFYQPNGVAQGGRLGFISGPQKDNLTAATGSVKVGTTEVLARGGMSILSYDANNLLYVIRNRDNTNFYTANPTNPLALSGPVKTYSNVRGNYYLDRDRNTWFMIYDTWVYMGLKTAPFGSVDVTGPTAPTNLQATPLEHERLNLTWTASTDNDTGVLDYKIYRQNTLIGQTKTLEFTDTGLTASTTYAYDVSAVNLHGTEGAKRRITVTTPADTTPPQITHLEAFADTTKLTVYFDEPLESASAQAIGNYQIQGLSVTGAQLLTGNQSVRLTLSSQQDQMVYTLRVNGVKDTAPAGNQVSTEEKYTFTLIPGLKNYLKLDQVETTAVDFSGAKHVFQVRGGPTSTTGKFGQAYRFNGSTDYLLLQPNIRMDQLNSNSHTFSAWIYPEGTPPATTNANKAYTLYYSPNLRVKYRSDKKIWAEVSTTNQKYAITSTAIYEPDRWHHVAVTIKNESPRQLALYVNGASAATAISMGYALNPLPINIVSVMDEYYARYKIGVHDPHFKWDSDYFKGRLDEIRLYEGALTAAQIGQIYNLNVPSTTPAPLSPTPVILAGDLNGDGHIDFADLLMLLPKFGQDDCAVSIIGTCLVDIFDFNFLASRF